MKQERAIRTRERILDAAAQEFAAHGYGRTTMQTVADRIRLTKGALYGHFTSKEELAAELVRQAGQAWRQVADASRGPGIPAASALRRLLSGLARRHHEEPRFHAVFRILAEQPDGPFAQPGFAHDLLAGLTEEFRRAQRAGAIPRWTSVEGLARLSVGAMLLASHAGIGGPDAADAVRDDVELLWDMVEALCQEREPPAA
ncbi:TetR/AcrR family transcriptional regulator [Streptomyces yokosukanensis]|uniref:TetR/AcrR family transcriptional regulator n=1 Tax=Streptomyces yokosukanensis TaxID=67386 RepID=UPI00342A0F91